MAVVYTGGTFDLFHPGHVELLKRCRELAGPDGRVVVSLNTDDFVLEYKRIRPTMDFASRRMVLEACRYVDLVIENIGGADSKPAVEVVGPDIIAVGEDWKIRDYHKQMQFTPGWLRARGIRIEYVDHLFGFSSSKVRDSLRG